MLVLVRLLATVVALALAGLAVVQPTRRDVWALLAVTAVVLGFVAPMFWLDLERLIAVRYLRRRRASRRVRVGLLGATGLLAAALITFAWQHGQHRTLETAAVVGIFVGALAFSICLLLYLFSVFTAVSALGVALGVAALVVVSAVTAGFEHEFQRSVFAVNGHLIVMSYGNPTFKEAAAEADRIRTALHGLPGLERIERFSLSAGEIMIGKVGANLKGVDIGEGAHELSAALVKGRLADLAAPALCHDAPAGRIILGAELAHKIHADVGQCVSVVVPFARANEDVPPSFPFRVVGIFHFGYNEYDARLAYVSLADAESLADARQSVLGVELRFVDPMQALTVADEVAQTLGPDMRVLDWKTLNGNIFKALALQKIFISIVLALIVVVAAFNIVASLTLVVISKVREIAILGSMGARRSAILRIFLVAGATVGASGAGLGVGLGLLVCSLLRRFGYVLDAKVYNIERLPVVVAPVEVLFVSAVALGICVVFTLFPAVRASRLHPLDGLRRG